MRVTEEKTLTKREFLDKEGILLSPTAGNSMNPFLKEGDVVVIEKKQERLSLWDVAFYVREEKLLLHRVVGIEEGGYLIRGDNTDTEEYVEGKDVLGVMVERIRKGERLFSSDKRWKRYAERSVKTYPVRKFFLCVKQKIKRILKPRQR